MIRNKLRFTLVFAALFTAVLFGLPAIAGNCDNACLFCDFHAAYACYSGDEYPMGKHYKIYSHQYYDASCKCSRACRIAVPCD